MGLPNSAWVDYTSYLFMRKWVSEMRLEGFYSNNDVINIIDFLFFGKIEARLSYKPMSLKK